MNKLTRIAACGLLFAGANALADSLKLSNDPALIVGAGTDLYTATETVAAYPTNSVGLPQFWLDADNTAGWGFNGWDEYGNKISEAPSLVVTETDDGNGSTICFTNSLRKSWGSLGLSVSPTDYARLKSNAALGGRNVIDFGPVGSCRMLWFKSTDASGKPDLTNVGTIIMLYDSSDGGGCLFSGANGPSGNSDTNNKGYRWMRESSAYWSAAMWNGDTGENAPNLSWDVGLFRDHNSVSHPSLRNGLVWHNGLPSMPVNSGFGGRWEVLSIDQLDSERDMRGIGLWYPANRSSSSNSGGMKVAEMLIYDKVLTAAERTLVEMYLSRKWFGESGRRFVNAPGGYNGYVQVGSIRSHENIASSDETRLVTQVDVAAGDRLELDRLEGGHGRGAAFVKNGAGTLVIKDAAGYGGTLTLREGETEFPLKEITNALPDGVCFDFDASRGVRTVTDANGTYVTHWENSATGAQAKYAGEDFLLRRTNEGSTTIRLDADALGEGMPAVDFGDFVTSAGGHTNGMTFARASDDTALASFRGIQTIVWVIDTTEGGGCLFGTGDPYSYSTVSRLNDHGGDFRWPLLTVGREWGTSPKKICATNFVAYVNGVRRATGMDVNAMGDNLGYDTPGWQVAAAYSPGMQLNTLGQGLTAAVNGGFRLAEAVGWRRHLSESEIRDAQAYLARKWLGRRMPGYADPSGNTVVGIHRLAAYPGTVLNVSGSGTVRVGSVEGIDGLVKTGAGTLELPRPAGGGTYSGIDVREGEVRYYDVNVAASSGAPAPGAAFHVDATDLSSMTIVESGGRKYVRVWHDADSVSGNAAYNMATANCPWLNEANLCHGNPVVDFGAYGSNRSLHFGKAIDNARSVYVVVDAQSDGVPLLGSSSMTSDGASGAVCDFVRSGSALLSDAAPQYVTDGELYIDGVRMTAVEFRSTVPSGYMLVEIHANDAALHASAFAADRATGLATGGGQRLGEVLIYNRVLSDREKAATRSYLMKKWRRPPHGTLIFVR